MACHQGLQETGRRARIIVAVALAVVVAASSACGTTNTTSVDAGLPPVIANPPLACSTDAGACSCMPADGGVIDASPSLCSDMVALDAACCAGPDYPFAGACTCSIHACGDGGGGRVSSCSSPPSTIDPGACDPSWCSGLACGGGECCTSFCQDGVCQQSCS